MTGVFIEPTFYTKVTDSTGAVYMEAKQERRTVMSKQAAYIVKDILKGPVQGAGGTATNCSISGMSVAAKTGTTDSNTERWLCGFTPYYAAATWYGYDDSEEIRWYSSNPASVLWIAVMRPIHSGLTGKSFERPDGIVSATICKESGMLATDKCSKINKSYSEIYVKGTAPAKHCEVHSQEERVCKDSGQLANAYCTNVELRSVVNDKTVTGTCQIHKKPKDTTGPKIALNGSSTIRLLLGETYVELRRNSNR